MSLCSEPLVLGDNCDGAPFRAPPGLALAEDEPLSIVLKESGLELVEDAVMPSKKKPGARTLSLADLCSAPADSGKVEPPPGLEFLASFGKGPKPPPGLEKGVKSDDSTAEGDDSGQSDGEGSGGLVLMEVSELKASSPMFRPMFSGSDAANLPLPNDAQRTPLRTKLSSKANLYQPSTQSPGQGQCQYPFVPMSAVNESWQKWHMRNSLYAGQADFYSEQDSYDNSAEYYSDHDCISKDYSETWQDSYDTTPESYEAVKCDAWKAPSEQQADFYSEPEWAYEM